MGDLGREPPRRMRENSADYLLYVILDRAGEQLRPIAEAYANRLGFMHQTPLSQFSTRWLAELDELHLELIDLGRSIRPVIQVIHHLSNADTIRGEEKMYLEDVAE